MTPLQTFYTLVQALEKKPFVFFDAQQQKKFLMETIQAIVRLKKNLDTKNLQHTHAYKELEILSQTISPEQIQEVPFIQHLGNLVALYNQAPNLENIEELLNNLNKALSNAQRKLTAYHLALEYLQKKAKKMKEEEKLKSDLETLQKVGIFYVLEYTLQVLYEFSYLKDADKQKLMTVGLKTKAGNLPGYLPLEDTFREQLCFKILDNELRNNLFSIFYKFEELCYNDVEIFGKALKNFNLEVLKAFQTKGLKTFQGFVYTPFGNNILIEELIAIVQNIKL